MTSELTTVISCQAGLHFHYPVNMLPATLSRLNSLTIHNQRHFESAPTGRQTESQGSNWFLPTGRTRGGLDSHASQTVLKNVDQNCQPLPYKAAKQSVVYNTTLSPTSVCHVSIQKSQHNHPCKKLQQNVVSLAQRTPNHTSPRRERCIALIQATASLLQHRAETLSFPIHGS